jgi:hypothetical protein
MDPRGVPEREFEPTIYSNVFINLAKIVFYNLVTEPELVSNLVVLHSLGHQLDEF